MHQETPASPPNKIRFPGNPALWGYNSFTHRSIANFPKHDHNVKLTQEVGILPLAMLRTRTRTNTPQQQPRQWYRSCRQSIAPLFHGGSPLLFSHATSPWSSSKSILLGEGATVLVLFLPGGIAAFCLVTDAKQHVGKRYSSGR